MTVVQAGADIAQRSGDELTRLPFLRTWFRTRSAIVLHLSNGTLQVNKSAWMDGCLTGGVVVKIPDGQYGNLGSNSGASAGQPSRSFLRGR